MEAYVIGCVIDPVELDVVYPYFPLHCTLVHWFLSASTPEEIDKLTEPIIQSSRQFEIISDDADLYGTQKDIPVHTVKSNEDLANLHKTLLQVIKPANPTYTIPYLSLIHI